MISEPSMILLVDETEKAGRVVGQKGATMQSLKLKSGTSQIRMQKDPQVCNLFTFSILSMWLCFLLVVMCCTPGIQWGSIEDINHRRIAACHSQVLLIFFVVIASYLVLDLSPFFLVYVCFFVCTGPTIFFWNCFSILSL